MTVPFSAGCYELRHRDGRLILFGTAGRVASRMTSLLPKPFVRGHRSNAAKRAHVLEHLEDIEYRTAAFATGEEAKVCERGLKSGGGYIFPTKAEVLRMGWQYTKRPDGKIAVTLDNNVWHFLSLKKLNLALELPPDEFAIFMPREVEIETEGTPVDVKGYIARTIADCGIKTTLVFGFTAEDSGKQRRGGFDVGTWQSRTEGEFYAAISERFLVGRREKRSGLTENEADAALAAQSFFSIVLTCENRKVNGPLRFAAENGGAVLYLADFDPCGHTLKAFIVDFYQKL